MKKAYFIFLCIFVMSCQKSNLQNCPTSNKFQFPTNLSVEDGDTFFIDGIRFKVTEHQDSIRSTFPTELVEYRDDLEFFFPASSIIFDVVEDRNFMTNNNHISLAHTLLQMLSMVRKDGEPIYEVVRNGELHFKGILQLKKLDKEGFCISSQGFNFGEL